MPLCVVLLVFFLLKFFCIFLVGFAAADGMAGVMCEKICAYIKMAGIICAHYLSFAGRMYAVVCCDSMVLMNVI